MFVTITRRRHCFCLRTNQKTANFTSGIIENFKSSQDRKKRTAVVKCMIKGIIPALTWAINRLYPIENSPYLMDEKASLKFKFINEKNINC